KVFKLLICLGSGRCRELQLSQPRIYQCISSILQSQPLFPTFFPFFDICGVISTKNKAFIPVK
ncbi:MAG: hypothetical protein QNJ55_15485, partial [Xenococcus sp. MO_188.B8]|nr:hypothetical protein [Xenococcus sp. MO_188.B8]